MTICNCRIEGWNGDHWSQDQSCPEDHWHQWSYLQQCHCHHLVWLVDCEMVEVKVGMQIMKIQVMSVDSY